ncbi:MAG: hypothetical protein LUF25_05995, partial [Phascolarctobacterium sp.]|nr:hypothetical protein [Phascolarctobacterium sp.]
ANSDCPPRYGFVCELYSTTDSIAMDFVTVQLHFTIGPDKFTAANEVIELVGELCLLCYT